MKKSDTLAVEYWPLSRVIKKRWTRNAKLHDIGKLCESIERYGFRDPIGYDATLDAFAEGNGRAEALIALRARGPVKGKPWPPRGIQNGSGSEWQVPILVGVDARTKYEAEAYALDHNNLTMSGGDFSALDMARMWDDNLNQVLLDLAANDTFSVVMDSDTVDALIAAQTGFGQADAEPQIDRAKELNRKWKVKTGDLWRIGEHRLLCGDSTRHEDVERVMGGEKAEACVTDPPYGMDLDTDWTDVIGIIGRKNKTTGNKYAPIIGDDKPFDPAPIFELWDAKEMFLFGADYYAEKIPNRLAGSWLVWDKRKDSQADAIGAEFELCWSKVKHKRRMLRHDWFGFLSSSNASDAHNRQHPNQKPVTLMSDILGQWTPEGCIISDPFVGSGTTLVACQNFNRRCRAIEISPAYCAVTLQRISDAFPGIEIERIEHGETKRKARGNGKAAR